MDQNQLSNLQNNLNIAAKIDFWLQIFLLVVVGFYVIFAFIVFKQIKILNKTIHTPRAGLLNNVAMVHLAFAAGLLAVTILLVII